MLLPARGRGELTGVRALLAAVCCAKGEVEQNLAAHLELLARAAAAGCELALFPEMSLTGSVDPAAHRGTFLAGRVRLVGGFGPGRRAPPRAPPRPVDRPGGPGRIHGR